MTAQRKTRNKIPFSLADLMAQNQKLTWFHHVQIHLVVTKSVRSRLLSFGEVLRKVRRYVVRYRRSGKAKAWLFERFPKKIPGYVVTRW